MPTNYLAPLTNYLTKTLSGAINDTATTITLSNTTNMTAPGYIVIDRTNSAGDASPNAREVVSYTGISGSDLTGCTRGADGSTARTHVDAALVETMLTVGMWNSLATIVGKAVTNDGYLRPIASPMSISILQISTLLNASGASIVGIQTDPLLINKAAVASLASLGRAEVWGMALVSTASVARLEVKAAALQSIASTAIGEFEVRNQDGNISIKAGASKLVGISVLSQSDTTNAYLNNAVVLVGWGHKIANGTNTYNTETVTFGITFAALPYVITGSLHYKDNSDPSTQGDTAAADGTYVGTSAIATAAGQFDIYWRGFSTAGYTNAFGNIVRPMYSWIAVGRL